MTLDGKRSQGLIQLFAGWGVKVDNVDLINTAFIHPTYAFENPQDATQSNQRLEFLGDAVLGLMVAEHLYRRFPNSPEGDLTRLRAAIVCESSLAKRARELGLGFYLMLGKGEEFTGGRERPSVLADAFEAVVGAIYLDAGQAEVSRFVVRYLVADQALEPGQTGDHKTLLQEIVQRNFETNVSYVILKESGPDHDKRFQAGVTLEGKVLARGFGRSKKEAEQEAARRALSVLRRKM